MIAQALKFQTVNPKTTTPLDRTFLKLIPKIDHIPPVDSKLGRRKSWGTVIGKYRNRDGTKGLYYYCKHGRKWNKWWQVVEGKKNYYGWFGLKDTFQMAEFIKGKIVADSEAEIIASEKLLRLEGYELFAIVELKENHALVHISQELSEGSSEGAITHIIAEHAKEHFSENHKHEEIGAGEGHSIWGSHIRDCDKSGMEHDPLHTYRVHFAHAEHHDSQHHEEHRSSGHEMLDVEHETPNEHDHRSHHEHHSNHGHSEHPAEEGLHHIWGASIHLLAGMGHNLLHMFASHHQSEEHHGHRLEHHETGNSEMETHDSGHETSHEQNYHSHEHHSHHTHHSHQEHSEHAEEGNHHIWGAAIHLFMGMGHNLLHMFQGGHHDEGQEHIAYGSEHTILIHHIEQEEEHGKSEHEDQHVSHSPKIHLVHSGHPVEKEIELTENEELNARHPPVLHVIHGGLQEELIGKELIHDETNTHDDSKIRESIAAVTNEEQKAPRLFVVNDAWPPRE
ncbi:MAG: hypothetical protein Q7S22_00245 [Candidatus Micrarchaeota archaeon]|nr:hypothetical protein [Candidatus Micrarchaeota archaeon]